MPEPISHKQMDELLSSRDKELRKHLDEKFKMVAEIDKLKHDHISNLMDKFDKAIEQNSTAVVRVHSRVDRIDAQIKTVKGVGTFVTTMFTALAGWFTLK